MSAVQTKAKKSSASKKVSASKTKGVASKTMSHPPFADIIRECIVDTGDRTGVSRPTIKKFVEDKYKLDVTPAVISNINRAIAYGAEKGTFVLPKGPSGKVKLAPKNRASDSAKENTHPVKVAAPVKKPAAKPAAKPVKKSGATVKTSSAGRKAKLMAKKPTPSSKKVSTKKVTKAAAPAKKMAAKRAPAKKTITGTTKSKPSASKARASVKGKTSSAAPTSKRQSASAAKPTSKVASAKPVSPKK